MPCRKPDSQIPPFETTAEHTDMKTIVFIVTFLFSAHAQTLEVSIGETVLSHQDNSHLERIAISKRLMKSV